MYYLLSLFSGILVAVMIVINGSLSGHAGLYTSTVFIHASGLVLILAVMLIKREKLFAGKHAWYLYIGGPVGVSTVVFNNFSFGRISVSAILALILLGQSVLGLIVDQFGWFGMPRHPFIKRRAAGLLLIVIGIAVMIDNFEIIAVLFSFLSGAILVITRTTNARLAELTSVRKSTLLNYTLGLATAVPVMLILGRGETGITNIAAPPEMYIYLGGAVGVCVVLISNVVVVKISAFYLTLLAFTGQVFSGVALDALISRSFSPRILIGGALVSAGLCADLLLTRAKNSENHKSPL